MDAIFLTQKQDALTSHHHDYGPGTYDLPRRLHKGQKGNPTL